MSQSDEVGDSTEIQAVSRASQILALFGPDSPALTAAEAASQLGLNRSTAYRYCSSLVTAGLLERGSESGQFIPGALLVQLGAFALGRRKVMDLALPHLQSLAAMARTTAVLSLWGSVGPVVSRVEEEPNPTVFVTVRVGTHLPIDTAQAMLFAAYHSNQVHIAQLLANVPASIRPQIETGIAAAARHGYSSASSTPGVVAIAAPVFDEYGICATLAVLGTDNLLSAAPDAVELSYVISAARDLTKELGGHYAPDAP